MSTGPSSNCSSPRVAFFGLAWAVEGGDQRKPKPTLGLWKEPFFPKYGYERIKVMDVGWSNRYRCDMCKDQQVAKVHVVKHLVTGKVMKVGSICAGLMTGEDFRIRRYRIRPKSRAGRFIHADWNVSRAGNEWINVECGGCYFTVIIIQSKWSRRSFAIIKEMKSDGTQLDRWYLGKDSGWFYTEKKAKKAAFDWLKENVYFKANK